MEDIRAFTMGDQAYFLGIVALLNSLRLTGHAMPLTVLDLGLADWQVRLLEPHCELTRPPDGRDPMLQKQIAPLRADVEVAVLLDGDVLVTGSLEPLLERARAGSVVACRDANDHRRFPEWTELFGLQAPLRRQTYLNAGAVVISNRHHPELLARWAGCCDSIQRRAADPAAPRGRLDPLRFTDQDALNALLMSEVAAGQVHCMERTMVLVATDLAAVAVLDEQYLVCSHDGHAVSLLHAAGPVKPWRNRAAREYRDTAYDKLLRRVLTAADVELRLDEDHLPFWLRTGRLPAVARPLLRAYHRMAEASRPLRRSVRLSPGQRGRR